MQGDRGHGRGRGRRRLCRGGCRPAEGERQRCTLRQAPQPRDPPRPARHMAAPASLRFPQSIHKRASLFICAHKMHGARHFRGGS
ncbi:hypothetical protein CBM2587_B90362 [Cupriavidus taiwanensis]|uniref:Uncharacterized protein n=1 Tax=Cupriavidus taiwanensis TaxID=164546 RepID=A0A375CCU2_9BURK|nr:hypothetical protein CBM2587_B90362 [Cupriavidus taiwanensis]